MTLTKKWYLYDNFYTSLTRSWFWLE